MIVECYGKNHVGDRVLREKEPFENKDRTSTLCDKCFELEQVQVKRALKLLREAGWERKY